MHPSQFHANGAIMRQTPKPWEAIGMSRASWYRHGKPSEKPQRFTKAMWAHMHRVSLRTMSRIDHRVTNGRDEDFALMLLRGEIKPGLAERIIADPRLHRRFRKWLRDGK